jgi:hypothetical protein
MTDRESYPGLTPELLAALQAPGAPLPGEHAVYERVVKWVQASGLTITDEMVGRARDELAAYAELRRPFADLDAMARDVLTAALGRKDPS